MTLLPNWKDMFSLRATIPRWDSRLDPANAAKNATLNIAFFPDWLDHLWKLQA